jgi:hypothetical protein
VDGETDGGGEQWRRLFTVEEANALLPSLIPMLETLRRQKAELDEARLALARLTPAMRGNGHGAAAVELERRFRDLANEITLGVRSILAQGVEVKDLDQGLIDFPSPRGDRVVYLCWRLGEGQIAWWHELDGGFAGRQPL